jgi:hypothetical protein
MTDTEIAELERLEREATPGPWSRVDAPWRSSGMPPWVVTGDGDPHGATAICDLAIQMDGELGDDGGPQDSDPEADAAFIAAARNALPALLAEVRAARDARAQGYREGVEAALRASMAPLTRSRR